MHLLGGDQREAGGQVVAHLVAEQAASTGAGPIRLRRTSLEHQPQEILVGSCDRHSISLRPEARSRTDGMPTINDTITTPDGTCPVTFATPDGAGPWPAVVMYPDAGGVRDVFRDMAAQLA